MGFLHYALSKNRYKQRLTAYRESTENSEFSLIGRGAIGSARKF